LTTTDEEMQVCMQVSTGTYLGYGNGHYTSVQSGKYKPTWVVTKGSVSTTDEWLSSNEMTVRNQRRVINSRLTLTLTLTLTSA